MTDTPEALTVALRCRLEDLRLLHDAVEGYCQAHRLPNGPVGHLQLALEEHVTNIMRHGGNSDDARPITVQVQVHGDELVAEVKDTGPRFNPLELPSPDIHQPIDERPLGGLGIHMMRQLTDRLDYRREGSANVLTLHKNLSGSVSA